MTLSLHETLPGFEHGSYLDFCDRMGIHDERRARAIARDRGRVFPAGLLRAVHAQALAEAADPGLAEQESDTSRSHAAAA